MSHTIRFSLLYLLLSFFSINNYAEVPSNLKNKEHLKQSEIQRLYQASEDAIHRNKWDEALRKLQLLNIRYPSNPYLEKSKLSLIVCYMQKKEFPKALISVDSFIREHPKSDLLEYALQLRSDIEQQNASAEWGVWSYVWRGIAIWTGLSVVIAAISHR